MFTVAASDGPSVHWIVSIMAGAPFGFGMLLVFLSMMNYLIDCKYECLSIDAHAKIIFIRLYGICS